MFFHIVATVFVGLLGFYLNIEKADWLALLIVIGLVIVAEMINTSLEYLTDIVSPQYNEKAGKVKDMAAGAVLIAAIVAVITGSIIFIPKVWCFFS